MRGWGWGLHACACMMRMCVFALHDCVSRIVCVGMHACSRLHFPHTSTQHTSACMLLTQVRTPCACTLHRRTLTLTRTHARTHTHTHKHTHTQTHTHAHARTHAHHVQHVHNCSYIVHARTQAHAHRDTLHTYRLHRLPPPPPPPPSLSRWMWAHRTASSWASQRPLGITQRRQQRQQQR